MGSMRVAVSSDAYLASKDKLPRRDSATNAMLPLYHRTMRFLSDPYKRMKKRALLGAVAALVILYVMMVSFATHDTVVPSGHPPRDVEIHDRPGFQAPKHPSFPADGNAKDETDRQRPGLRRDGDDEDPPLDDMGAVEPPQPIVAANPPREERVDVDNDEQAHDAGGAGDVDGDSAKKSTEPATPASKLPYFVRMVLPLLAGFCFGFLGSVPVAGPTSAMVLKLGIQGKYQTALTIAFGGAISEATYAGVAFWGFGSFLAGAKFLLPVSKVLGAVMFTIVGIIFLKSEVKSPLDIDPASASHKGMRARPPRDEFLRNLLMGLTMSGINPSLLATYTGAIASVYGTGLLEFTLFLAFVFGIGVCCGVSTWFFILVSLLQKYKQRLKKQTIGYIMRGMGCFLLTLGALCAKSSFEYFVWGATETKP